MEGVVAPAILRQDVPSLPQELVGMSGGVPRTTILDILIDENGNVEQVEQAVVRESAIRIYDSLLSAAARNWKYRPAMKDDTPVKFLKTLEIVVKTGTEPARSSSQWAPTSSFHFLTIVESFAAGPGATDR
jgi:hypothetical protein